MTLQDRLGLLLTALGSDYKATLAAIARAQAGAGPAIPIVGFSACTEGFLSSSSTAHTNGRQYFQPHLLYGDGLIQYDALSVTPTTLQVGAGLVATGGIYEDLTAGKGLSVPDQNNPIPNTGVTYDLTSAGGGTSIGHWGTFPQPFIPDRPRWVWFMYMETGTAATTQPQIHSIANATFPMPCSSAYAPQARLRGWYRNGTSSTSFVGVSGTEIPISCIRRSA